MTVEETPDLKAKNTLYCSSRQKYCTFKSLAEDKQWAWIVIEGFRSKVKLDTLTQAPNHSTSENSYQTPRSLRHIHATLSDAPCTSSCWHAEGNVCVCSCYGKNHGIGHNPESK